MCFVPKNINALFTKSTIERGKFPIGVCSREKRQPLKPYVAQCRDMDLGKQKSLGSFETPEEAFLAYKAYKEKYIKRIADRFKDQIPEKLYEAMYNYQVEITD